MLGEKARSCAQLGGKKFSVAACSVPAQTPACGEGFLPRALVWAAGLGLETEGDCRLRGRPRGRPLTSVGDTQPTRVALPPRRRKGLQAPRAHACSSKDISEMQAKHTPWPQDVGGGGPSLIIFFLTDASCQSRLRVVQIYHG